MTYTYIRQRFLTAAILSAMAILAPPAQGQSPSLESPEPSVETQPIASPFAASLPTPAPATAASQLLLDFKDSDIKFHLWSLMSVLRDKEHEGWVLAAYPDPNTSRPLIGAGFSLDVAVVDHPQLDPLNPNPFLEPSSAQLWQAAGLDPQQLQRILEQFDRNLEAWTKKGYRRKIRKHTLPPDVTEEEATRLLRISAIQAVVNAQAYCRNFDQLTGLQQMAFSQLVFQMGVNLEEFVEFLSAINGDASHLDLSLSGGGVETNAEHWRNVQNTLIDSQWARRYSTRASTVIAMFDPNYETNPTAAERRVAIILRPPVKHRRKSPPAASLRAANEGSHAGKRSPTSQSKRKLT